MALRMGTATQRSSRIAIDTTTVLRSLLVVKIRQISRRRMLSIQASRPCKPELSPLHAEFCAQPVEVNIDEAVDRPIRVGARDDCQDRKQHDVRQTIQLPLRPPRVFDFSQQVNK